MTTEPPPESVFLDPTGRRARRTRAIAALVAILALTLVVGFAGSLLDLPNLGRALPPQASLAGLIRHRGPVERQLLAHIRQDEQRSRNHALVDAQQIAGGYFAPWEEGGLASFEAHARDLTHIYPTWLKLAPDGRSVLTRDWDPALNRTTHPLERAARANGVRIVPVIGNATEGVFDAGRVQRMLADRGGEPLIGQLVGFVDAHDYAGLQIDFELMTPNLVQRLEPWMAELHRRLAAQGKELSVTLEVGLPDAELRTLVAHADYGVAMIYDEHNEGGAPGPIASASFVDQNLRRMAGIVPASKLVLGVGVHGYDWRAGAP